MFTSIFLISSIFVFSYDYDSFNKNMTEKYNHDQNSLNLIEKFNIVSKKMSNLDITLNGDKVTNKDEDAGRFVEYMNNDIYDFTVVSKIKYALDNDQDSNQGLKKIVNNFFDRTKFFFDGPSIYFNTKGINNLENILSIISNSLIFGNCDDLTYQKGTLSHEEDVKKIVNLRNLAKQYASISCKEKIIKVLSDIEATYVPLSAISGTKESIDDAANRMQEALEHALGDK